MKPPSPDIVDVSDREAERASTSIPSPLGPIELVATADALVAVRLSRAEDVSAETSRRSVSAEPRGGVASPGSPSPDGGDGRDSAETGGSRARETLDRAARELSAYFRSELRAFSVPVAFSGTPFQEQVWRGLLTILYGERRSYGWLAEEIGRPTASRAVGAANGCNPIPIVVPCHRVIGADGSLTGYGGGLENKRWLLEHEAGQQGLF